MCESATLEGVGGCGVSLAAAKFAVGLEEEGLLIQRTLYLESGVVLY